MPANYVRTCAALSLAAGILAGALFAPVSNASAQGSADVLSREKVLRDPDIPSLGNANGDVTIVEYFDYQCPYCKKLAPVLAKVIQDDGKVRLVLKDWPIFGDLSVAAAKLVLAAKCERRSGLIPNMATPVGRGED